MSFTGHIQNGVVVFDSPIPLPEGTPVKVEAVGANGTSTQSWIQKTPGVCGGRACIRNTRITVWGLVNSRRLGATDDALLKSIAGLTREDLTAAWDYYRDHTAEIDANIRENEAE